MNVRLCKEKIIHNYCTLPYGTYGTYLTLGCLGTVVGTEPLAKTTAMTACLSLRPSCCNN